MMKKAAVALTAVGLALTGCASMDDSGSDQGTGMKPQAGECEYISEGTQSDIELPGAEVQTVGTVSRTLHMSEGDVTIVMDREATPCTVHSFEFLADQGFYDGTSCHRLVTDGMSILQCGDPTGTGMGGPGYTYADELFGDETYPRGTVAMANAGPDTNGSQFFFVFEDTTLSPDYTVFGAIDDASLEVIDSIAAQGVSDTPPAPVSPALIESVS